MRNANRTPDGPAAGRRRRAILGCAAVLALTLAAASPAGAQDAATDVVVFHGAGDTNGLSAIQELGTANDFDVTATSDAAALVGQLDAAEAVIFLNSAGDRLTGAQETALQEYVESGHGFVGIGTSATAEPGNTFFDGLIGARPNGDGTSSQQTVVAGDRVHPSTRDLPSSSTGPTSGTSGRRARQARCTRSRATTGPSPRPATAPTSAARITRSPGAATTRAAAPSTPAWGAPQAGSTPTCALTCSARSSGRRA